MEHIIGRPQLKEFLLDIKFSHSLFAFPFATAAFFLEHIPVPSFGQLALLCLCMVCARSFAMGVNRVLDANLDRDNPRTSGRAIPAGRLSRLGAGLFTVCFGLAFIGFSFLLSIQAFYWSVPVLVFLGGYSLMKRSSFLCHAYLGVCLGLSPTAVHVALVGDFSLTLLLIGLGVAVWTAGFDILYALQDMQHDKKVGLHSMPSKFGVEKSVLASRVLFSLMIVFLTIAGIYGGVGGVYYLGVGAVGCALVVQHILVAKIRQQNRFDKIGKMFFDVNAWISCGFLVFVIIDHIMLT